MFRSAVGRAARIVPRRLPTGKKSTGFAVELLRPAAETFHGTKWHHVCARAHRHGFLSIERTSVVPWTMKRLYADFPSHSKIPLPALSPTMEEGNIGSWAKKEGDKLSEGDLMVEIETDKAVMGFEAPEEGYLAKILIQDGEKNVPVGKLLCIIVENESDVAAFASFKDDSAAAPPPAAKAEALPATGPPKPAAAAVAAPPPPQPAQAAPAGAPSAPGGPRPAVSADGFVKATPLARKIAQEQGLDLKMIGAGTGPNGAITAADVASAKASGVSGFAATSSAFRDIPVSSTRAVIAQRLTQSKQTIPHYYLTMEIRMDEILRLRKKFNEMLEKDGLKISVNDFIIKGAAHALLKVPAANSSWMGASIREYQSADISVAVSTDAGLITPIIFGADKKGLGTIATDMKALAAKARDGKLQPQEFQGGTFSVSNLGMYGIKSFAAVINPPQSCLLAVGGTTTRAFPNKEDPDKIDVSDGMCVTLSCDHRVVDGAVGAQWLQAFRSAMENPAIMVL